MARYMAKGISKFWFTPTLASLTAPSHTEIVAGEDLTVQMAEITGFTFENNPIDTPDMNSAFVSKIPGEDATTDSGMTFYRDLDDNPISDALVKGDSGYVVIFASGYAAAAPAAADVVDVWPVSVASNAKQYTAANEAAKYLVKFTPLTPPHVDVACT